MEILKATVRFRNKSGLYPVYIRFTQVKQVSYVKTSWMVNDKGINERKEIIDPFVIKPKLVIRKWQEAFSNDLFGFMEIGISLGFSL